MTMQALTELGGVVEHATDARHAAKRAARGLEGARATRARELVGLLADVVAFAERLEFVVQADLEGER